MDYQTPPPSPINIRIPNAPEKKQIKCYGCRIFYQNVGGGNQEMHMGYNGCLEVKNNL